MHGLDQYDFHARQYDPSRIQFNTVDPLAEKYYNWSPYVYCYNNPINVIDPDGKQGIEGPPLSRVLGSGQLLKLAEQKVMKQIGFSMINPKAAMAIGEYKAGSNNISTRASSFEINLLKAAGVSRGGPGDKGNALRHGVWQALITKEFGAKVASEAGFSHENGSTFDLNQKVFKTMDAADTTADLLNNIIGRDIATNNPSASNVQLAGLVLDALKDGNLWTVSKGKDGQYTLQQSTITQEQYNKAKERLNQLGENGLTK